VNTEVLNSDESVEVPSTTMESTQQLPASSPEPLVAPVALFSRGGLFHTAALRDLAPRTRLAARRLGPAGLGGLALLFAAVVVVFGMVQPIRRQALDLQAQLSALDTARSTMRDQAQSPVDNAGDFLNRFPTRAELPAVVAAFGASANKAGVTLEQGTYSFQVQKGASLARYVIDLPVKGSYPAIRQFVSNALVAVPAASLDTLRLERREVADGSVDAALRFTVFVRSTP
jgi:Tfp pilus assembly protein PilO